MWFFHFSTDNVVYCSCEMKFSLKTAAHAMLSCTCCVWIIWIVIHTRLVLDKYIKIKTSLWLFLLFAAALYSSFLTFVLSNIFQSLHKWQHILYGWWPTGIWHSWITSVKNNIEYSLVDSHAVLPSQQHPSDWIQQSNLVKKLLSGKNRQQAGTLLQGNNGQSKITTATSSWQFIAVMKCTHTQLWV